MKYKYEDFGKLLDVFANITENRDNPEYICQELHKIVDYPTKVIQVFIDTMMQLENKGSNYLKENYMGIAGLTIMRMNLTNSNFKF